MELTQRHTRKDSLDLIVRPFEVHFVSLKETVKRNVIDVYNNTFILTSEVLRIGGKLILRHTLLSSCFVCVKEELKRHYLT